MNDTTALAKTRTPEELAALQARFGQFLKADVMGVRRYIEAGNHVLLVKRAEQGLSKNTDKLKKNASLEKTVFEFKVVETQLMPGYEAITDDPKKKGWARGPLGASLGEAGDFRPLTPDESCSAAETNENNGYAGNVLSTVAGILGYGFEELKADPAFYDVFSGCFSTTQLLAGHLVRCIATQTATTSATAKSKIFTAKTFEPIHASDYHLYGVVPPPTCYGYDEYAAEQEAANGESAADATPAAEGAAA